MFSTSVCKQAIHKKVNKNVSGIYGVFIEVYILLVPVLRYSLFKKKIVIVQLLLHNYFLVSNEFLTNYFAFY